ncbi:MAG TPA: SDR family NAD(P)-dependent oxidoreductase, partial [Pseudonocardiaceae bacterium]|nr:SDR family NAD(P)-dependent oxidoreductase [Pseudonocardiaceae bacterium]
MSSDLTGKVALVTGASGGIGTALVEALVERGATVVATSRNHQNPTTPGRVHHRQLDVADLESLQPFVAQVIDEFGSL